MTPPRGEAAVRRAFDVERVRADFPILRRQVHGHPLVYLDNAATPQKPQAVLDAIVSYYTEINANVHRGVHDLSERATTAFEAAREKVRGFFNAREAREIVFTRNATESINLVAWTFGRTNVGRDDEVVVTAMEHHSNLVPWQMLCEAAGARLRVAPIDDRGELLVDELERLRAIPAWTFGRRSGTGSSCGMPPTDRRPAAWRARTACSPSVSASRPVPTRSRSPPPIRPGMPRTGS